MKKLGSALPPLPATSVFHSKNRRVNRDRIVSDAATFFERLDAGGKRVRVIGAYGYNRTTNLRIKR
jgi:hypothetical protein